jgi:ABC-type branched-subunit amino acid transport system substrate-binding protein
MSRDWTSSLLSRRGFLKMSGAAVAAGVLSGVTAGGQDEILRIGAVLPVKTGSSPVRAATHQAAGEAARMGAILAEEHIGIGAERAGTVPLEVLIATAPHEEAAVRSAERLAAAQGIFALVGGFGRQAQALAEVAAERRLPFLNIGSAKEALRRPANNGYTFNVEASAEMYLNVIVSWFNAAGVGRVLVVHGDDYEDVRLAEHALRLTGKSSGAACRISAEAVPAAGGNYSHALGAVHSSDADLVLLLLDPVAQLDFLGQYELSGLTAQVTGFPHPVAQTREFLYAVRHIAPVSGFGCRAAIWEGSIDGGQAGILNESFRARWGRVMDPSAWAAYQAVAILYQAAVATGSVSGPDLASHLARAGTDFEIGKEAPGSFGETDHQLRQSLYIIRLQPGAKTALELARLEATLPTDSLPGNSEGSGTPDCEAV